MVIGVNVVVGVNVGKGGNEVKVGKRLNVGRDGAVDSKRAGVVDAGVPQALRIKIHARIGM